MIEKGSRLPALHRVAARAIFPQLTAVLILMAACAFAGKSQVRSAKVLDLNPLARCGRNEFSLVTTLASDSGVLPGKRKSRLAVIQSLAIWFPVNQLKIGSIVVRMAGRTFLTCSARFDPNRVHSALLRQALANFRVAIQTLEFRRATSQVMAFRAVRRTGKRLVGSRKRTRRDLCKRGL